MNRYIETLRKPRWIAAVVVGVLLAGVCVRLGFWQLDRLDQRRDRNPTIEARPDEIPRPLIALR
ncbi:MAG: hypothetical protein KDB69_03845, partial [Acidimicrobiia bacterium]|nr:hypothetical protein [Acidimicrobiia bacterium]